MFPARLFAPRYFPGRYFAKVGALQSGGSSGIGTAAVQIVAGATALEVGIYLKAAAGNGNTVYIGASSAVTAGTTAATDGYPLAAGDEIFIPVDDASKIWAIAGAADQILHHLIPPR